MTQAPLKKRTILYIVTKSNWGGAQRYVYDLAVGLPRDSYDVAVAFGGTGIPGSAAGTLATMLANAGIRTILIPELGRDISAMSDWRSFAALWRLLRQEHPDVVHLNSSKAGGLGALAARLCGVPRIIFTAHGWYFWERKSASVRALTYFLSYLTILLSHTTICISEHDRRAVRLLPFASRKIRVVRNGIAPFPLLPRNEARGALFSTHDIAAHHDDIWAVSIGELTGNKNYLVALDAIARHNATAQQKIFYAIIGDGEQRRAIEQHIDALQMNGQAKLLGFVPDARRYYRAFDMFFLPSQKEGVPYVILEAGLAQLPVVASRVGGIPEVIRPGESGILCPPDEASSFARALANLTDDPALRARLGTSLRETVAREYGAAHMLTQTTALY